MKKIVISFDLEFWHNSELLKKELGRIPLDRFDDRVAKQVQQLLPVLAAANAKATFFVLGKLAEKHPEVIKSIFDAGHEIASHGYSHLALTDLTPEAFEAEVIKTNQILKNITGADVIGFRAPAFSLTPETAWAIPILVRHGFKYDSSIFPSNISHYGSNKAPLEPYAISEADIYRPYPTSPIKEIPVAIAQIWKFRIPSAGGIYFRLLPFYFFKHLLRHNQKISASPIYFHPHEFDPIIATYVPASPLHIKKNLLHANLDSALDKLKKILTEYEGVPISQIA